MNKNQQFAFKIHDEFQERQDMLDAIEIPLSIINNLNPKFQLRDYQKQAFKRLCVYYGNEWNLLFPNKSNHLGFNMATGSGKTLIMAGIILYFYEQGYRNFLFFSTSRQIIDKTKDNFLNSHSGKYLFNQNITIDNKHIHINECDNFEYHSDDDINILFTTINGLHSRLQNIKENQITIDDFKKHKTIIIGDEAHHFNVKTKAKGDQLELWNNKNWENTIDKILNAHDNNKYFELSATFEFSNHAIYEKYKDKIIYKYDIQQFRNDKFSKDILIIQSDIEKQDLILQAIIFNQYKQEIASQYGLNIKPIILFKANRFITESNENQKLFNEILNKLNKDIIDRLYQNIKQHDDNDMLLRAFDYFAKQDNYYRYLINTLQRNFATNKQLNVNESEAEKERDNVIKQETLLNSLENQYNQIRVIFAVNKLNEGWDVLNLFDIVRLYNNEAVATKPTGTTKKQTVSEAQLIGRGARYYPFMTKNDDGDEITYSDIDRYRRKFDDDPHHDLRILEELYYHSQYNSAFIASLHEELIEQGWEDDPNLYDEKEIKIKPNIQISDFWRKDLVIANKKIKKRYDRYNLWDCLSYGEQKRNFEFKIPSGVIVTNIIFDARDMDKQTQIDIKAVDLPLSDIPMNIKQNAFQYHGTKYFKEKEHLYKQFTDKTLKIKKDDHRINNNADLVKNKDWFVYDALHGTSEEVAFVKLFDNIIYDDLTNKGYHNIYLVRNEEDYKIYDFDNGDGFCPDFLLFMSDKDNKDCKYQVLIEPKGKQLELKDDWKNNMLQIIKDKFLNDDAISFEFGQTIYHIIGMPFYNTSEENKFTNDFKECFK